MSAVVILLYLLKAKTPSTYVVARVLAVNTTLRMLLGSESNERDRNVLLPVH